MEMWAVGWGVGSSLVVHCGGKGSLKREEVQASSLNTSLKGLAQTKVLQCYERSQKVKEELKMRGMKEEGIHSNAANAV